jgi:hypothetical protein
MQDQGHPGTQSLAALASRQQNCEVSREFQNLDNESTVLGWDEIQSNIVQMLAIFYIKFGYLCLLG